jgi:hypothetical protein
MTTVLTILGVWVGAACLAVGIPVGLSLLRNYLSERKQRRAMWEQIDGFLGNTRLPL